MEKKLRENLLHSFGHVLRQLKDAPLRKVENRDYGDFRRSGRRLKVTWMEGVLNDMKINGVAEALDKNE